tara:strand:+ start:181 stop:1101 length:921 start_codon:yes stop_codon:yes gene_type:complete
MSNITKAKKFDATQITYRAPTTNKRGGKNVQIQMKGSPLVLQIPLMLTWGMNERVDDDSGRVSYDMALQFQPDKHPSISNFLESMKVMEEKVKNDCVKNSKLWFGKTNMSREVIDVLMYPLLKYPRKKDDSGETDYTRDPTLKLKIPYWEQKFSVELYDMDREIIFQEVKKVGDPDGPQGNKTPVDLVPKGSNVNGLIGCTGLWFAGGKCGVTWKLIQACVRPPIRLVGTGTCHVEVDSDDEDLLTNLNKDQDDIVAEVKEALPQPTFVDSDEDEDEVEDEVEEVVPSPKKKVKKKIVRKKKKASE